MDISKLRTHFTGRVIGPKDGDYSKVRTVFYGGLIKSARDHSVPHRWWLNRYHSLIGVVQFYFYDHKNRILEKMWHVDLA